MPIQHHLSTEQRVTNYVNENLKDEHELGSLFESKGHVLAKCYLEGGDITEKVKELLVEDALEVIEHQDNHPDRATG